MHNPRVGQRVAYAAKFLRSIGADKDIADMRGHIVEVKGAFAGDTLVKVLWEGESEVRGTLAANLSLAEKGSPVQDL